MLGHHSRASEAEEAGGGIWKRQMGFQDHQKIGPDNLDANSYTQLADRVQILWLGGHDHNQINLTKTVKLQAKEVSRYRKVDAWEYADNMWFNRESSNLLFQQQITALHQLDLDTGKVVKLPDICRGEAMDIKRRIIAKQADNAVLKRAKRMRGDMEESECPKKIKEHKQPKQKRAKYTRKSKR